MTSLLDLPPEIFDYIIDLLRNERGAVKNCCTLSKWLVPLIQRHIYSDITIKNSLKLKRWLETFPDFAKSPTYHTRSLRICSVEYLTDNDPTESRWIQSFTNVVQLEVQNNRTNEEHDMNKSLVHFHTLSSVKSLRVAFSFFRMSEVFKLICSLPLLENLDISHIWIWGCVRDDINELGAGFRPQGLLPLTGTLVLSGGQLKHVTRLLLALPRGLHFHKIVWKGPLPEGLGGVMILVEKCCNTLEYFYFERPPSGESLGPFGPCNEFDIWRGPDHLFTRSIDLSKATKLKEVSFSYVRLPWPTPVAWITAALKSITREHQALQQISIHFKQGSGGLEYGWLETGERHQQWRKIEYTTLVQLCESHGCRMKVVYHDCSWKRESPIKQRLQAFTDALLREMRDERLID